MLEFKDAQVELGNILKAKLLHEKQDGLLEARAQRITDKYFKDLELKGQSVLMGQSKLRIVGAQLGFHVGSVFVSRWLTRFEYDQYGIHSMLPNAIALGYANGYQLYIAKCDNHWTLCARWGPQNVTRWNSTEHNIPRRDSILFAALERAKQLGYLPLLRGEE